MAGSQESPVKPAGRIEKGLRRFRFSGFSKTIATIPNMLPDKSAPEKTAQSSVQTHDEPLPATLTFVVIMGVTFAVLWFGLFVLMRERW